jgi:N-acetylglucosaminyldiphosphoundecaprenol N-acetyl-beta-D-mannosaminyltransferase
LTAGETHTASVDLLGVRFAAWTEQRVVDEVFDALRERSGRPRGGWIVTPNVDVLRQIARSADVRALVSHADVFLADGIPLIWASRVQGTPLPERVTGAALLPRLSERAAAEQRRVFLLGGADGVAAAGVTALRERHPGIAVDGWSPPFGVEATPEGMAEIRARVSAAAPDLVFCGFGFPKQERVIYALHDLLPDAWFVGCGAALNFVAGEVSRAPGWMQRNGLEWVHRLWKEPRRLFRRYVVHDIPFTLGLLYGAFWRRWSDRRAARTGLR